MTVSSSRAVFAFVLLFAMLAAAWAVVAARHDRDAYGFSGDVPGPFDVERCGIITSPK